MTTTVAANVQQISTIILVVGFWGFKVMCMDPWDHPLTFSSSSTFVTAALGSELFLLCVGKNYRANDFLTPVLFCRSVAWLWGDGY